MTTQRKPLMDISNNDVASSPVANGSRRKSGRAVRAPEKFVPETASSQPPSAKRKRGEDVENTSDVEEEEIELSEAEEDSAVEEGVKGKRRKPKSTKPRKPANKKPKVNGPADSGEVLAVRLPNRPKKATSKKVAIADQDGDGLYAEVYTSGQSSEDVASQWLSRYDTDPLAETAELVNLVLRSAGCTLKVTENDINDADNADGRLADLQEEYQTHDITDYPLISKAKSVHQFRLSLEGFFDQLIEAMHKSEVMYNSVALIETIHMWLATMSSSTSRPFRHTATVAALAITDALCRVASEQLDTAAQLQRQIESEQKTKKGGNKARIGDFLKRAETNENHKDLILHEIKDFFDAVYVHRYRDIDPKIRLECVEALGDWILTLASLFYEGTYLRYMGWMLSDPHAPMRLEVIRQLLEIMNNLNHGGIRHFIDRFRPRLVEMATRDSDPGVRASTVELMQVIRRAGFLEPNDIDVIGKLIFDSDPKVRKSVVAFFAENVKDSYDGRVEELGGVEALEGFLNNDEDESFNTPKSSWIRYKCLAESLLSYDAEDQDEMPSQIEVANFLDVSVAESRFSLAAQALFDNIPDLQDWDRLAGYLLFDHSITPAGDETERALRESYAPEETEELILLDILNTVVKLSLSHIEDSEKGKKRLSKAELQEVRENAARRLANLIPRLLKKYGADPKTATVVLRLEHVLNLRVFEELRQDGTVYSRLLDEISAQFNGHADKGVLGEAGAAFLHAQTYDELKEVADTKIQTILDDVANSLRKINKAGTISVRGAFKNKLLTDLSHTLARLDELSKISNTVEALETDGPKAGTLPIQILLDIIARGVYEDSDDENLILMEDEVVQSAIRSAMFYFMWKTSDITKAINNGEEVLDLEIQHLKEWQDSFATNLTSAFSSRATLDAVRLLGAGTLLDFHVLFATLRPAKKVKGATEPVSNEALQELIVEIDSEVQAELVSIFDALEKQYAKKSKRKLAEPGDDEAPEDLEFEPEDEDDDEATDNERQADSLKAEMQLCQLTGKLVLAILAQVIDASGPTKGHLRQRLQRNRHKLGPSFRDVVAYLDDPKSKLKKKSHKTKAQQNSDAKKKTAKSAERVDEEDDEDDPFANAEPEEGTVEDLRRRELFDEEPAGSAAEDGNSEAAGAVEADDEDKMGD